MNEITEIDRNLKKRRISAYACKMLVVQRQYQALLEYNVNCLCILKFLYVRPLVLQGGIMKLLT